jgi:hypothetical protein
MILLSIIILLLIGSCPLNVIGFVFCTDIVKTKWRVSKGKQDHSVLCSSLKHLMARKMGFAGDIKAVNT